MIDGQERKMLAQALEQLNKVINANPQECNRVTVARLAEAILHISRVQNRVQNDVLGGS